MVYSLDPGRRQRKRQAVHDALLSAAETLFRERGVTRTTMDDIAEAADVARQTVFNYFPYKEVFALEIWSSSIETVAHRAGALLESGESALHVLQSVVQWLFDQAAEDGEIAAAVARELLVADAERAARAAELVPLSALFESILIHGQEEQAVRLDLPMQIVAGRVTSILISVLTHITSVPVDSARNELAVCFDILFNGITERRNDYAFVD